MLFDRPAWIAFAGAILLALITLFSSYNHVFIPGFATSFPLPAGELNWHPTVDMKVQSYALEQQAIEREQRIKQLKKENARLSELDAKLNAILSNSGTSSIPPNAMPGESKM